MDFTEAYPDRCSTVGFAVRAGDVETLKRLIAGGASVNVHDNRGWTPLHEAAHAGQLECVQLLLSKTSNEDVNVRTWEGETALFLAASFGHEKILKLLIKHGGNPNISNNEEGSPILQAVAGNYKACIELLLKTGADVNSRLFTSWSLLHEAACHGFSDVLLLLLRAGANTGIRDDFGIVPVFTSAQYGRLDCLKILIQHGADPNAKAEDNATALYLAAQEGHSGCVEYLLTHGASVNISTNTDDKFLPIHVAAYKGRMKCLELLLPPSLSALETCNVPDEFTPTPLHLASMGGYESAVRMLLEAGCDPDCGIRNPSKEVKETQLVHAHEPVTLSSPFYYAVQDGHFTTAKTLLDSGACICHPSIHYCLLTMPNSCPRALKLLIDHRADVRCRHVTERFLMTCSTGCLKILVHWGLRFCFSCTCPRGLCPDMIDGRHYTTEHLRRLIKKMKVMHSYVDRLCMCQHSIAHLHAKKNLDSQLYDSWKNMPQSLLHLSRVAITEHIGTARAPSIIPRMDFLPNLLKDYLLYKDVYRYMD